MDGQASTEGQALTDGQALTEGQSREAADAASVAELFERLARAELGPPGSDLDEAVALLAFSLAPEVPRAEARQRLLAALPGSDAGPGTSKQPALAPVVSLAEFARRERRANRAIFLMAAALVVCLVGMGYLYGRLSAQETRQSAELETLSRRMHMVTSVARYAYRMQSVSNPPAEVSQGGKPQGIVYVCGAHQQWILSLEHLAPPPPGHEYHVYFESAEGEVDGGPLRVGADARADMEDVKLPPGTRGFSVTLEPIGVPGDPLLVMQSQDGVEL